MHSFQLYPCMHTLAFPYLRISWTHRLLPRWTAPRWRAFLTAAERVGHHAGNFAHVFLRLPVNSQVDGATLAGIRRQYGDFLYAKRDYDAAMEQ